MAGGGRGQVGILGGTFNPPHLGHLAAATHARDELGLELAVLMPASTSPHKRGEPDPGPEDRLQMCRLAVAGRPGVGVCELELKRGGTSYTVDTLRAIHASHPNAELTLIVGADTAVTLPAWRQPEELLALADLAVVARGGSDEDAVVARIEPLLAEQHGEVRFLRMPAVEISSSLARERAAAGAALAPLVGSRVAAYIHEHRLYGAPERGD